MIGAGGTASGGSTGGEGAYLRGSIVLPTGTTSINVGVGALGTGAIGGTSSGASYINIPGSYLFVIAGAGGAGHGAGGSSGGPAGGDLSGGSFTGVSNGFTGFTIAGISGGGGTTTGGTAGQSCAGAIAGTVGSTYAGNFLPAAGGTQANNAAGGSGYSGGGSGCVGGGGSSYVNGTYVSNVVSYGGNTAPANLLAGYGRSNQGGYVSITLFNANDYSLRTNGDIVCRYVTVSNTLSTMSTLNLSTMNVTDLISSQNGTILLGSGSPTYRLHITGTGINNTFTTGWRYGFGGGAANTSITDPIHLRVQTGVWASIYYATSDERSKTNISPVEDRKALDVVRQLQPVTYEYIDQVSRHHQKEYGFIAQDVVSILPGAITTQADFIPNVYQIAHWSTITLSTTQLLFGSPVYDIQKEDLLRLIDDYNMPHNYKVLNNTDHTITIDANLEEKLATISSAEKTIFVYGKQVNDLHILEKHAIFSVGMAALKELDRIIVEQDGIIKQQQQQIEELERDLNKIRSCKK
jgi:hypothetical protein